MAESKEKLLRVIEILNLTDEKSPITAPAIVKVLWNKYGVKADRKSIYSDIDALEICGYKIKQCQDKKKGWYMDKHYLDDWELKILIDAVKQAKCITSEDTKILVSKLASASSERGRRRFASLISIENDNKTKDAYTKKYIEILLEAMYLKKKIGFQYTEMDEKLNKVQRREGYEYKLNLYSIEWSFDTYYLICVNDKYGNLTNYRLDRVENLRILEENATDPKKFFGEQPDMVIKNYIHKNINHFNGDSVRITLECKPERDQLAILYDFAGENIRVQHMAKDRIHVSFTKLDSSALVGWLLQYSNMFKLISPENIKDEVKQRIKLAEDIYNM